MINVSYNFVPTDNGHKSDDSPRSGNAFSSIDKISRPSDRSPSAQTNGEPYINNEFNNNFYSMTFCFLPFIAMSAALDYYLQLVKTMNDLQAEILRLYVCPVSEPNKNNLAPEVIDFSTHVYANKMYLNSLREKSAIGEKVYNAHPTFFEGVSRLRECLFAYVNYWAIARESDEKIWKVESNQNFHDLYYRTSTEDHDEANEQFANFDMEATPEPISDLRSYDLFVGNIKIDKFDDEEIANFSESLDLVENYHDESHPVEGSMISDRRAFSLFIGEE